VAERRPVPRIYLEAFYKPPTRLYVPGDVQSVSITRAALPSIRTVRRTGELLDSLTGSMVSEEGRENVRSFVETTTSPYLNDTLQGLHNSSIPRSGLEETELLEIFDSAKFDQVERDDRTNEAFGVAIMVFALLKQHSGLIPPRTTFQFYEWIDSMRRTADKLIKGRVRKLSGIRSDLDAQRFLAFFDTGRTYLPQVLYKNPRA